MSFRADTSKLHFPSAGQHGHKGAFLHSLASLSLLSITSRHQDQESHSTISFHHSRPIVRLVPAPDHHELPSLAGGTRVTVHDLFGNMPVRVKQRANEGNDTTAKVWDDTTRKLAGILLAWFAGVSCSVELKGGKKRWSVRTRDSISKMPNQATRPIDATASQRFNLSRILTTLSKTGYITPSSFDSWVKASARTPTMSIRAAVSLQPAPTKQIQFISFGISPVEYSDEISILYDDINQTFSASGFGAADEPEIDDREKARRLQDGRFNNHGLTSDQLRGGGKGIDRWPMFYVRIELERQDSNPLDDAEAAFHSDRTLQSIVHVMKAMFVQFLQEHNFRPRFRRAPKAILDQEPSKRSRDSSPLRDGLSTPDRNNLSGQNYLLAAKSHPSTEGSEGQNCKDVEGIKALTCDLPRTSREPGPVEDFMNTTIKLPDFTRRKQPLLDTSLGPWSRIKSGGKHVFEDICSGLPRSKRRSEGVSSLTEIPTQPMTQGRRLTLNRNRVQNSHTYAPSAHPLPLFATPSPRCEDSTNPEASEESGLFEETPPIGACEDRDETHDEYIPWKNPITQQTVLINSRTGVALQQDRSRLSSAGSIGTQSLIRPPSAGSSISSLRRLSISRSSSDLPSTPKSDSWIEGFLKTWNNPVFRQAEPGIPSVCHDELQLPIPQERSNRSRGSLEDMREVFEATMPTYRGRLSKQSLQQAEVIAQVDRKFVLAKLTVTGPDHDLPKQVLVLIDQHAADERCRIEKLFEELCLPNSMNSSSPIGEGSKRAIVPSTVLAKPIQFQLSLKELGLFESTRQAFRKWGIHYKLSKRGSSNSGDTNHECRLSATALPSLIAERCRAEPKLLIDLLRTEVWARNERGRPASAFSSNSKTETTSGVQEINQSAIDADPAWLRHIGDCPQGIIDMLNSRSCRTAIMFNDVLSIQECEELVSQLAKCAFPFQCAHGRPSMIPLLEMAMDQLGHGPSLSSGLVGKSFGVDNAALEGRKTGMSFGEAYRQWTAGER
jgi:DNA mismatch repair protein MLH3